MKVTLYPTLDDFRQRAPRIGVVVVIDVLRFTSTVIAALEAGAKEIVPVEDVEFARSLAGHVRREKMLLAGEIQGRPVEGFDIFNSPLECRPDLVGGTTIIMSTSNGSRAAREASIASRVIICAINNISSAARAIEDLESVHILCSGSEGAIAAEDLYCGGLLIEMTRGEIEQDDMHDAGLAALNLARSFGEDGEKLLRSSKRGMELVAAGYEDDVIYCSKKDISVAVPEMSWGALRLD